MDEKELTGNVPVPPDNQNNTIKEKGKKSFEDKEEEEIREKTSIEKSLEEGTSYDNLDKQSESLRDLLGYHEEEATEGKDGEIDEDDDPYKDIKKRVNQEDLDSSKLEIARKLNVDATGVDNSKIEEYEFENDVKREKQEQENKKEDDGIYVKNGIITFDEEKIDESNEKKKKVSLLEENEIKNETEDYYSDNNVDEEENKKIEARKRLLEKIDGENPIKSNKTKKNKKKIISVLNDEKSREVEEEIKPSEENKEEVEIDIGSEVLKVSKEEKELIEEIMSREGMNETLESANILDRIIEKSIENYENISEEEKKEFRNKLRLVTENEKISDKSLIDKVKEEIKNNPDVKNKISKLVLYGGKNNPKKERYHDELKSNIAEDIRNIAIEKYKVKTQEFNSNDYTMYASIEAGNVRNTRKVKVPLLASNLNVVMREYQYIEQHFLIATIEGYISIIEDESANIYERNKAYYNFKLAEIISLYDHIEYLQDPKTGKTFKPPFTECMKMIKYCDLDNLFYAAYVTTHDGINRYSLYCDNLVSKEGETPVICGNRFEYATGNESLQYSLNKSVTLEDLLNIRGGFKEGEELSESMKKLLSLANMEYKRAPTKYYKHVFHQRLPSINDYIETMKNFNAVCNIMEKNGRRYKVKILLSNIDGSIYDKDSAFQVLYLKTLMCTYAVDIFTVNKEAKDENGNFPTYYLEVNVDKDESPDKARQLIFDQIYRLSKEEIDKLFGSIIFKKLCTFQTISHYVSGAICPKCGKPVRAVRINMETDFFLQMGSMI